MTADSQWELQQGIYTALTGAAAVTALVGTRIFDHTPQDSDYPYVMIGDTVGGEFDTKSEEGMEQTVMIHVWSQYRGQSEIKQIMEAIVDALDKAAITVTGHTLVDIRFEFSDTMMEADGLTRHGVQRFRATTTKP